MSTKTLSVDEEAYERLRRARLHPRESFSTVIKRANWGVDVPRCGDVLRRMDGLPLMDVEELDKLDRIQREGKEPEDKWSR